MCIFYLFLGSCIYVINTGIQVVTNKLLKEETRKGNIELNFEFRDELIENYYCTIYSSYPGEFIVRKNIFFTRLIFIFKNRCIQKS